MAHSSPFSTEQILEQLPFFRRLAYELIADAAEAEDMAQEVALRLLKSPPGDGRSLRGWGSRVVRHLAYDRHRRQQPEVVGEMEELDVRFADAADESLQNLEAQRRALACIQDLDEIHRVPIYERYVRGRSVAEIAAVLGVPDSTLNSQLRRGKKKLREKLDKEYGSREQWLLALAPLAGLEPPGPAAASLTPVAVFGAGALLPLGVGALALAAGWLAIQATRGSSVEAHVVGAHAVESGAVTGDSSEGSALAGVTALPTAVRAAASPACSVRVSGPNAMPVEGAHVHCLDPAEEVVTAVTDGRGFALLQDVEPGRPLVVLHWAFSPGAARVVPGALDVELAPLAEYAVDTELLAPDAVAHMAAPVLEVWRESSALDVPAPLLELVEAQQSSGWQPIEAGSFRAPPDAGSFALRAPRGWRILGASAGMARASGREWIWSPQPGARLGLQLDRSTLGAVRVFDPRGPVAQQPITVVLEGRSMLVVTDADGLAAIDVLEMVGGFPGPLPEKAEVCVMGSRLVEGLSFLDMNVYYPASDGPVLRIDLAQPVAYRAPFAVFVRDDAGTPVAGASVATSTRELGRTDASGRLWVENAMESEPVLAVRASAHGIVEVRVEPGAREVDAVLPRAADLTLDLRPPAPTAAQVLVRLSRVDGASMFLVPEHGTLRHGLVTSTDFQVVGRSKELFASGVGLVELSALRPGKVQVEVLGLDGSRMHDFEVSLEGGQQVVEELALEAPARVSGTVRAVDGRRLDDVLVRALGPDTPGGFAPETRGPDGPFELELFRPGSFDLAIEVDRRVQHTEEGLVAGVAPLDIRLDLARKVWVEFVDAAGTPVVASAVAIRELERFFRPEHRDYASRIEIALPDRDFVLDAYRGGFVAEMPVSADHRGPLTFLLPAQGELDVLLPDVPPGSRVLLEVESYDPPGLVFRQRLQVDAAGAVEQRIAGLPQGRYEVALRVAEEGDVTDGTVRDRDRIEVVAGAVPLTLHAD